MTYVCPVCGYPNLEIDPKEKQFNICSCCATEFGNDDVDYSHDVLRKKWIEQGAQWWYEEEKPAEWDAQKQLNAAGLK